jgi:hypothetical protein
LNGIATWSQVLDARFAGHPDPEVRRALRGIAEGIERQVRLIENHLEAGAVEPPLRRPAMSKRNDAQPDIPEESTVKDKPERPDPALKKEQPGGRDAARAQGDARNKTTREGER